MLVIRRTESGELRMTDRRRTDTAATEEQARRLLMTWGYGNFSINKALTLMKEAEGSIEPVENPWVVRSRKGESQPAPDARAEERAGPKPETATPASLKEPPTMNAPARARRARAPQETEPGPPAAEATGVAEEPVTTVEAKPEEPAKKPAARKKRARGASGKKDAGKAEPAAEAAPPAPAAEEVPPAAAPEASAAPPEAEAPAPRKGRARKPRAGTGEKADGKQKTEVVVAPAAEPAPVAETAAPAARPKRSRPSRNGARKAEAAPAARTPEERLEAARALFAEGTRALKELEGATLPFARGPWTELREKSAEILTCLQGKDRPRS